MRNEILNKIKVWKNPDGSLRTMYFLKASMRPGESEDDFIARVVSKLKTEHPIYNTLEEHDKTLDDLPKKDKRKWRMDPDGKIKVDQTVKTQEELDKEKKDRVKDKLKNLGIDEADLDVLLN